MGKRQFLLSKYRVPVWGDEKALETASDMVEVHEW